MFARPAREGVRFVIADVADGRVGIYRLEGGEGHHVPLTFYFTAITGGVPALVVCAGEAIHQPQRCGPIAAVADEGEPFAIRYEIARDPDRTDERAMRRVLVVEMRAVVDMADVMDAFVQRQPVLAGAGRGRETPIRVVGRRDRVLREGINDVGEYQF